MGFINEKVLKSFSFDAFHKRWPFPWWDFKEFLTPEGFETLCRDFPALELFEYHENRSRSGAGQRPHNRYYLAYQRSIYHREDAPEAGIVEKQDLSQSWQQFLEELETSLVYRDFIKQTLNVSEFDVRYVWHAGKTGSEVSPHLDHPKKLGTHIFYFNTSEDWDPAWGGELVVLGGKLTPGVNPEFSSFTTSTPVSNVDNHSFLFKNEDKGWHGVKALKCPEGKYRKLFNVIFERPGVRTQDFY